MCIRLNTFDDWRPAPDTHTHTHTRRAHTQMNNDAKQASHLSHTRCQSFNFRSFCPILFHSISVRFYLKVSVKQLSVPHISLFLSPSPTLDLISRLGKKKRKNEIQSLFLRDRCVSSWIRFSILPLLRVLRRFCVSVAIVYRRSTSK